MKRVVLISPPHSKVNNDRLDPPLGLMYLSSALKKAGHKTDILDYAGGEIHALPDADIYGFITYSPTYSWSVKMAGHVKQNYPESKVIAGGAHVSALPDECIKDWDHIVVGEGEEEIVRIANGEAEDAILYADPIMNPDSIEFPDYDSVDIQTYDRTLDGEKLLSIFSSRGCPYNCAFCNSIVWTGGKKVRFRTPENVADEISYLQARFGVDHYRFIDELFAMSVSRVNAMAAALGPLGIVYRSNARCNTFTSKMAVPLYDSGCVQVEFGVESGSLPVLKAMNKQQTPDDIRRSIGAAKEAGLKVRVYLIVGFPGETWDTVNETCDLMIECMPDEVLVHTPVPFPGTPIYKNPEQFGITWMDKDLSNYMQISKNMKSYYLISHETADRDMIAKMWEHAVERLSVIKWYHGKG